MHTSDNIVGLNVQTMVWAPVPQTPGTSADFSTLPLTRQLHNDLKLRITFGNLMLNLYVCINWWFVWKKIEISRFTKHLPKFEFMKTDHCGATDRRMASHLTYPLHSVVQDCLLEFPTVCTKTIIKFRAVSSHRTVNPISGPSEGLKIWWGKYW